MTVFTVCDFQKRQALPRIMETVMIKNKGLRSSLTYWWKSSLFNVFFIFPKQGTKSTLFLDSDGICEIRLKMRIVRNH